MKINDAVFGAVLMVLGAAVLWHVQAFPKIPGQQVGPALFPGLISAGLVVTGALLVTSGLRARRAGEPWFTLADWMGSRGHFLAFAAVLLGGVAYVYLAESIGFLLVAPVLLFVWMVAFGVKPARAALVAVIGTLAIWYVFYKLLRVPLPWGVLTKFAF
jgi:putative tricarboxylic transport membrane protein